MIKGYLQRAIKYYEKGFKIRGDYYTGENYALCLDLMKDIETDQDEKVFLSVSAKKVRKEIISILEPVVGDEDDSNRSDEKWIYATLSNCHWALKSDIKAKEYECKFFELTSVEWERETFNSGKEQALKVARS